MFVIGLHFRGDCGLVFKAFSDRQEAEAFFLANEVLWPQGVGFGALYEAPEADAEKAIEAVKNSNKGVIVLRSFPHEVSGVGIKL